MPRGALQGDRILGCPGKHRQQVVFVETTEQSFLSQAHLLRMLLPQQIERAVPHRSHGCRGMVLPHTAAVFVERDLERPMELMLDMPMLAHHRDEGGGRPHQTRQVDTVGTRHRGLLVGHPHCFDDHYGLEGRPCGESRERFTVCHDPDSSAYTPSVGVVEGIKAMGRIAPRAMVLELLMNVRFEGCLGLCMGVLSCQQVVTSWSPDVLGHGRLTAHRIPGDHAACDGEPWEECRNGRHRMRFGVGFALPPNEPPLLRTPG